MTKSLISGLRPADGVGLLRNRKRAAKDKARLRSGGDGTELEKSETRKQHGVDPRRSRPGLRDAQWALF